MGDICDILLIIIKNILKIIAMGRKPKTNFLLFLVPSATSLLIAVGKLNVAIVINKLNVGKTNI